MNPLLCHRTKLAAHICLIANTPSILINLQLASDCFLIIASFITVMLSNELAQSLRTPMTVSCNIKPYPACLLNIWGAFETRRHSSIATFQNIPLSINLEIHS
jgi:hypothetical protein